MIKQAYANHIEGESIAAGELNATHIDSHVRFNYHPDHGRAEWVDMRLTGELRQIYHHGNDTTINLSMRDAGDLFEATLEHDEPVTFMVEQKKSAGAKK
ncbi:hypothetical protein HOT75_gp135 [Gordonia phage Daredevil]|uniref:Uncharacterized protein n=1 Tax=Gordonia phage Daredevil TaxID=2283286 RepID=A0A345MIZ0_9CAUD|nr:hypothetical protein HOT75_gp135 [Gordonia phage Daredevil]AXH70521.1 hypothetical protein SEA_DAREDEVIL_135 [Gordonia phage Daredevil]